MTSSCCKLNMQRFTKVILLTTAHWLCLLRPCLLNDVVQYTKTCTDTTVGAKVSAFHDTLTLTPADHLDFSNGIDTEATCTVVKNDCFVNMTSDDAPGEPHALRLSQLLATNPAQRDPYQLTVNVSWRAAYYRTEKTRGYQVTIVDREQDARVCFTYLFGKNYTLPNNYRHTPWFTFTISSWFQFGRKYAVIVQSLPKTVKIHGKINKNSKSTFITNARSMTFNSPEHPGSSNADVENCSFSANSDAGTWVGAFSSVLVLPWAKKLVAVFIAAPPKYCFEAYRVRLLKLNMIVEEAIVYAGDLNAEVVGNTTVLFGNHTFENVDYGVYSLFLLPQDRSSKYRNRCLCPLPTKMCVCSPAEWSDIDFQDPAVAPLNPCDESSPLSLAGDPFICRNGTEVKEANVGGAKGDSSSATFNLVNSGWIIVALLAGVAFSVATAACILRFAYKKYGKSDMILYTIPLREGNNGVDGDESSLVGHHRNGHVVESGVDRKLDVLVILSHDDKYHTKAVESLINLALFELGEDRVKFRTHFSCKNEIAENKIDWMNRNLYESDKILLINSYGAYIRYEAKKMASNTCRPTAAALNYDDDNDDDLFLPMLDLLAENVVGGQRRGDNMAAKLATAQFSYTPPEFALRHAALGSAGRRFRLPEHVDQLLGWLQYDAAAGGDRRRQRLNDCVTVDRTSVGYAELCRAVENVERNCLLQATYVEHKDDTAQCVESDENSPQRRQTMARCTNDTIVPSVHVISGATSSSHSTTVDVVDDDDDDSHRAASSSSDEHLRPLLLGDDAPQRRRNSSPQPPPPNCHSQHSTVTARSSDVSAAASAVDGRRMPPRRPSLIVGPDEFMAIGETRAGDVKTAAAVVGDSADSGICCDMPSADNCASGKSSPKKRSLDEAINKSPITNLPV